MSEENVIYAGVDDGHRETKLSLSIGNKTNRISFASRAMSGVSNKISLNGFQSSTFSYNTSDGPYSLGDIETSEDTAYDEYPYSAQNRVIVAHALRLAGLGHQHNMGIVSGLPLKRFFLRGRPNVDLIVKKKANLTSLDVVGFDGYKPPKIVKHDVMAEAISAWVNYVIQRNEKGKLFVDKQRVSKRTAIIDIGGRTLDIAVVKDWELDSSRSTTDEIGMINIIESMRERLFDFFNGVEPTDYQVEQSVNTGAVTAWGKPQDVKTIQAEVVSGVVNSLRSTIKGRLKTAQDIDTVFFVGGTSEFLAPHLKNWFRNQEAVENPSFANADGMGKFAEYLGNK